MFLFFIYIEASDLYLFLLCLKDFFKPFLFGRSAGNDFPQFLFF